MGYANGIGRLTSSSHPAGSTQYTYSASQLSAISLAKDSASTAETLIGKIKFSPFGPARSWEWKMASGSKLHKRLFDTSGRWVRYPLGTVVRDLAYDAAGRTSAYKHWLGATGSAQPAFDQGFAYDALSRLTGITSASASWSIGYDANGNRASVTLNGSPSVYTTAAASNRLESITSPRRAAWLRQRGQHRQRQRRLQRHVRSERAPSHADPGRGHEQLQL